MSTCPRCRGYGYAYRQHPAYGMIYHCDYCKVEGEIIIHRTDLHREVRQLSPFFYYRDFLTGAKIAAQEEELGSS